MCQLTVVIRRSSFSCRASAGTVSRGEEEYGCSSVRLELLGEGRSLRCLEK